MSNDKHQQQFQGGGGNALKIKCEKTIDCRHTTETRS